MSDKPIPDQRDERGNKGAPGGRWQGEGEMTSGEKNEQSVKTISTRGSIISEAPGTRKKNPETNEPISEWVFGFLFLGDEKLHLISLAAHISFGNKKRGPKDIWLAAIKAY